ncbi:DNA glycosylase, partial [Tothia fuscella]
PIREHGVSYHRPGLLDDPKAQTALLEWFEKVSKNRDMPWRQEWIDPLTFTEIEPGVDLQEALKRRAYQVWISEIMLQQTRVETVRSYYQTWHTRWPRIEDLAGADQADVLGAWRGLGYYSRATRIHTAARKIVSNPDMNGMLPELPADLEAKVPGVGRYTAGAISSIVFGHAVPILDGNVIRVLSRQTGLYANMGSKPPITMLWEAADSLVKQTTINELVKRGVKLQDDDIPKSDIPSFWNQALMELGSTICKPQKPGCRSCPIRSTCMAYIEGERAATFNPETASSEVVTAVAPDTKPDMTDIEDLELCILCEPMDEYIMEPPKSIPAAKKAKDKLKQSTLTFGLSRPSTIVNEPSATEVEQHQKDVQKVIENHVTRFPMKIVTKAARNEECIVCIFKKSSGDGKDPLWLIEQRPKKGLLASLWQFPSLTIFNDEDAQTNSRGALSQTERRKLVAQFAESLLEAFKPLAVPIFAHDVSELGSITHIFSHIKLVMHVHLYWINDQESAKKVKSRNAKKVKSPPPPSSKTSQIDSGKVEFQDRKWVSQEEVESANFGSGMRKCW